MLDHKVNSDNFYQAEIKDSFIVNGNNAEITIKNYNEQLKMVFNEKKFKELLDLLNREFIDKNIYDYCYEFDEEIRPSEISRDQNDKNERHNISEEDYLSLIVNKILPYEEEMNNFFNNPRNKISVRIYNQLLSSFNQLLRATKRDFINIFFFFVNINAKMKERYRDEIEEYEDDLITLFLYYTYYLCDLDKDKVRKNVFSTK